MKTKIILLFVIFISIIYVIFVIINNNIIKKNKKLNLLEVIAQDTGYVIQKKNLEYENNKLDIYFPLTNYEVLNNEINNFIKKDIEYFKKEIKEEKNNEEKIYMLNFDYYETSSHISIVFHSFINYKIAHPITYVTTINYNKEINKIEDIYDYINKDKKFLNKIKQDVYNNLLKNNIYKDESLKKYLKESLNSSINIFEDYIVTEDGLTFIFEPYKVAPYVYGELQSNVKF